MSFLLVSAYCIIQQSKWGYRILIQEIGHHQFHNHYEKRSIREQDYLFIFNGNQVLLKKGKQNYIPRWKEIAMQSVKKKEQCQFLFTIDEEAFFLYQGEPLEEWDEYFYGDKEKLRKNDGWARYAHAVALHLHQFYQSNQYCGYCGKRMHHHPQLRALQCECGNLCFPKISPAIICAIIDGDRIVLTKYNGRAFKDYALIAGFCEIGETLEECVKREVYEEVGLKIKDLCYFGSQPWPYSQSMMIGFSAHLDGDATITREEEELSEALWIKRDEIPELWQQDGLTQHIMKAFKEGKLK